MSKLRIAGTVSNSITDGNGLRYTIFTQGCIHNCDGCHNRHTHSIDGGYIVDTDVLFDKIKNDVLLQGVTYSGGEPILQADALLSLSQKIKKETSLDITIYSGYTFEELMAMSETVQNLLYLSDYLVDGPFIKEQQDLLLYMRGSKNQRFIDLKNTFNKKTLCLIDDNVSY